MIQEMDDLVPLQAAVSFSFFIFYYNDSKVYIISLYLGLLRVFTAALMTHTEIKGTVTVYDRPIFTASRSWCFCGWSALTS